MSNTWNSMLPLFKSALKSAQRSGSGLFESWVNADVAVQTLLRQLLKIKELSAIWEIEELLTVIDDTLSATREQEPAKLWLLIHESLTAEFGEWSAIFPVQFPVILGGFRKFEFKHFAFIGPGNKKALGTNPLGEDVINVLNEPNTLPIVGRQASTLLELPLLTIACQGTPRSSELMAIQVFEYFRAVHDVYSAVADCQTEFSLLKEPPNSLFILCNRSTGRILRRRQPGGTMLSSMLKPRTFGRYLSQGFRTYFDLFFTSRDKIFQRLNNALKFFSRGYQMDWTDLNSRHLKFLCYVISLESIFSRDKNAPLRQSLADSVAVLCYPANERKEIHKRVKHFYDVRSSIVHEGKHFVDLTDLEELEYLSAHVIRRALQFYSQCARRAKNPDQHFFQKMQVLRLNGAQMGIVQKRTISKS